ncbi:MBL fold metallo-hydrolase [Desulfogranum mediterraneum]|uniref:MBL fold metallo-hydrolase n=1 Tax=Desulfogranum mediterraneum TaxID=160661 RepID=UPI0004201C86|nr:MBL fold metallo-hydrolase [Desulfogranum mediterraneum]
MRCDCTVLCENSVTTALGLIGEHGWAVHVATDDHQILFDTGQGLGLLHNSERLGVHLDQLDGIVISHGHYDHTSGLPDALRRTGPTDVFLHPDGFSSRYWLKDEECREIGIHFRREYLESLGARFLPIRELTEIFPRIFLSGEIPRISTFEPPDPHMKCPAGEGRWVQDQLRDDQSLVVRSDQGLVVILGCAHAGLINILNHVSARFPGEPIHALFGGTHLGFAGSDQFQATVEALEAFEIPHIGASHCTGLDNSARLHHHFKERFFFAAAGTKLSY